MAREAVLRDNSIKTSRRYKVGATSEIPKGTYLFLAGNGEVSSAYMASWAFVGFAHADKDSSDVNDTSITADKGAVYDLYASGAITLGRLVKASPSNYVAACTQADATSSMATIIGVAIESAADAEQINVEVYP